MKLSARNQFRGKITDIGQGVIVTSSIANVAAEDLDLKIGDDVLAVIKASNVMIGK